jgi:hypothetical protein
VAIRIRLLYFQNSKPYCIHRDFAVSHPSGGEWPVVPPLSQFNLTEYYSPDLSTPGQPIVYTQRSTLLAEGSAVLSPAQAYRLGSALDVIHKYFFSAYGAAGGWYALEVDWKFDDKWTAGEPALFIKQARPYPRSAYATAPGCSPAD